LSVALEAHNTPLNLTPATPPQVSDKVLAARGRALAAGLGLESGPLESGPWAGSYETPRESSMCTGSA
jgi:hypothetical protein